MLDKFFQHISKEFPFLLKAKLLVAISGGLDSVVLTHLLKKMGFQIGLAHVNFQLRGAESDKDALFVRTLGKESNIPVHVFKADTHTYAKENTLSIQMAARDIRYNWFKKLLVEKEYDYVLTAHHLDDNIETFFINLSRSSGLEGLTGIPAKNNKIIRPLLPFSREDIQLYAQENKIKWREDASNATTDYLRNKIRHKLLPILKEISPSFENAFVKTQAYLQESEALVSAYISQLKPIICEERNNQIFFSLKQLKTFPNQKAILYQLLKDYGFTQWQDVYNLIEAQTGKQVFSKSHYLLKDREFLVLGVVEETKDKRQESRGKSQETRVTRFSKGVPSLRGGTTWQTYDVTQILNIKNLDKNQESRDKTQEVVFKELDIIKLDSESVIEFKISFLKRTKALNFKSNLLNEAYFDASKIKLPLFVRKWQFGDYFYPLGMQGKKKLSDFLIDQKVSNLEKKKIWLLCDAQDQIIWVIGKRLDNRYKITDTTTEIFKITKTND